MPSLPILSLMVILPLLLIGATLLVDRIYYTHSPLWAAQAAGGAKPPTHARQAGMGSTGNHQT